jgi:hypothetical protein
MAVPTDQIIQNESGGDPTATNPNSSAAGAGQFIDGTWLSVLKQHRPDLAQGKSDAELLALKNDPTLASQPQNVALAHELTGDYASDNQAILAKNGLPVTPGSTYLAHFAGPQGAVKIMQADPNAPVSSILGAAAVKANPFLQGMTAQGLQAWSARKMGATSPVQQGQQPGAPAPAAPQQPVAPAAAPIFAGGAPAASAGQPYHDPAIQPSPIFAAQRRPIDLSGLRATLAARGVPIFANG